jgi:hypothetical protein
LFVAIYYNKGKLKIICIYLADDFQKVGQQIGGIAVFYKMVRVASVRPSVHPGVNVG